MQRNLCVTEYTCSYSVLWSNWCASSSVRLTNRESSYCCPQRVQKVLRGRFRWWKYLKDALQERVFKIYNHATPPKSQTSSFLAEQLHYFLTGLALLLCSPPVHFHLAATVIFTECWSSLTHGLLQMPPASVHRLSEPSPWPLKSSIMQPRVSPSSSGSPLLLLTLQALNKCVFLLFHSSNTRLSLLPHSHTSAENCPTFSLANSSSPSDSQPHKSPFLVPRTGQPALLPTHSAPWASEQTASLGLNNTL